MKTAQFKIKKTVKAIVTATIDSVKIKYPKQPLGQISIMLEKSDGTLAILKQFELTLIGDSLKVQVVK